LLVPYDLHLHSCLSPCGEDEMTPNNLVGMAQVMELAAFAVADHNTARQLPAVQNLAEEAGILLVPAIEITSAEEVHVLSLFPSVEAALAMGEELYAALPPVRNKPEIFGYQRILNEKDEPMGELEKLLINATVLPIDRVFEKVRGYGGVPIPAHIDKSAYSVLSNLGVIPPELEAKTVEISPGGIDRGFVPPDGESYCIITDSDAHDLETMSGHDPRALELEKLSMNEILQKLREGLV
jgi:PHP family Zn ribbon phosphoesterase